MEINTEYIYFVQHRENLCTGKINSNNLFKTNIENVFLLENAIISQITRILTAPPRTVRR